MSLIPVIAFNPKDAEAAARMLDWCADLSGQQQFDCIIAYEPATPAHDVQRAASRAFRNVEHLTLRSSHDGWPGSANDFFAITAAHMRGKSPWLWLEPDCVPTEPRWLEKLAADYARMGKPCLGTVIPAYFLRDGVWTEIGKMLAGVAIYHQNLWDHSPLLQSLRRTNAEYARAKKQPRAFDSYLANEILPHSGATPLIQHMGRSRNFRRENGQIVCTYGAESRWSNVVSPEAVLIHGVKDSSLIDLLRAQMAVPQSFRNGMEDIKAGRTVSMDVALRDRPPNLPLQTHEFIAPQKFTKEPSAWGEEAKLPPDEEPALNPYTGEVSVMNLAKNLENGHTTFPRNMGETIARSPNSATSSLALAEARKAIEHWPECKSHTYTLTSKVGRYRVACQCGASSPKLPEGVDWEAAWEAHAKEPIQPEGGDEPRSPYAQPAEATTKSEPDVSSAVSNAAVESHPPTAAKPRKKYKKRAVKPTRSAEAQAAINERMTALRAKRVAKKAHQQEAARMHH